MNLKLSENLRTYRRQNDITQEQLAAVLCVTPQTVSRWENGSAYPDVTLLVTIANYFSVSIDELVGREELYGSMKQNDIHGEVGRLRGEGKNREAYTLLKEAVKVYPNSYSLRSELAVTAARMEDAAPEELKEAIVVSRDIEATCLNRKIRATTHANHVFLAMRTGVPELAAHLAKTTGHIWESRELLLAECADDADYPDALREAIRKTLTVLEILIDESTDRRAGFPGEHIAQGMDWDKAKTPDTQLSKIVAFLNEEKDS